MIPYCGKKSIDFLCDYVDSLIVLVDIFIKDPNLLRESDIGRLKEWVVRMAELCQYDKQII